MVWYPSEEWVTAYCRALNECDDLETFGFSEAVLLEVTDLRLDELTVENLDPSLLETVPESVLDGLEGVSLSTVIEEIDESVRSSLPDPIAELLVQAERDVVDDSLYVYLELDGGTCFGPVLVEDPDAVEYECLFRAPATVWQSIVAGRPATAAVLSGDLRIVGNPAFLLKYVAELQLLCDVAADDVETEFLIDRPAPSVFQTAFDESLRVPIAVQKALTRQTALAVRTFTPF